VRARIQSPDARTGIDPNREIAMLVKTPASIINFNSGKWGPAGSHLYYVKDGDNWENVATRDGWTDARDLVEFNFKTRDP
jgi:hypothetical protein